MKVKQLIALLEQQPQDKEIGFYCPAAELNFYINSVESEINDSNGVVIKTNIIFETI